ncbi:MAG: IS256 family transposase, partial [Actinomycetota bacterium]
MTSEKNVAAVRLVAGDDLDLVPDAVSVSLDGIAEIAREGLLAVAAAAGLAVMQTMMTEEMTRRVGAAKHAKTADRSGNWHGTAAGSVVMGGRRVPVDRPRGRTLDGDEIELDTYATFSDDDVLSRLVLERMLAGVSTRRHAVVNEPVAASLDATARSTSRSSVSRRFVQATQAHLDEIMARDLSTLDVAVLLVDGLFFAEQCCVIALAVTADGKKVPVGIWLGDTENKTVVTALLADLVARGLDATGGLMIVIDGAKALAAGVRSVFGDLVLAQRCTLHKRRNVEGHLPKDRRAWVDQRLAAAFANTDPDAGERAVKALAAKIERDHPDAARSMLEGLDEMFTVRRLKITATLAKVASGPRCKSTTGVGSFPSWQATERNPHPCPREYRPWSASAPR